MKTFAIPDGAFFDGAQFASLYGLDSYDFVIRGGVLYCPDTVPDNPTLSFTKLDTEEDKLARPTVTAIIQALEAGTATGVQVQNILAKVIRYLRRENS